MLVGTVSKSTAAGKFSSPVQNSFTISFDDPAALTPGPTNFRTPGPNPGFEQLKDWDDSYAGEVASWGSFGGSPDEVYAGVVADAGPNGVGDNAARLYVPSKVGSFYTNLSWQVKGLQLGNSSGGTFRFAQRPQSSSSRHEYRHPTHRTGQNGCCGRRLPDQF